MANKYRTIISGRESLKAATTVSTGSSNAGEITALDSTGSLDRSLLPNCLKFSNDFGITGVISIGGNEPSSLVGPSFLIRVGYGALQSTTFASQTVSIGTFTGNGQDRVQDCVFVGQEICSLPFVTLPAGVSLSGVTSVGAFSLFSCAGHYNTAIGYQAGASVTSSESSLYLGFQSGFFNDTSNRLYIGNNNSSNLITGQFDNGRVGLNVDANSIKSTAIFQVDGTNGFYYGPRLTTTQRNAVVSPDEGAELYNLTTHTKQYWNGTAWVDLAATGGGSSAPVIRHYTTSQTITNERYVSSDGTNAITFTLPSALTATDAITFSHAGTLDLTITGAQTINGNANIQLRGGARQSVTIFPSNNLWWIA